MLNGSGRDTPLTPPSAPPHYISKPLRPSHACRFFLSSGSDVLPQRDLFERMTNVMSDQFRLAEWAAGRFHLEVDRWEADAPRRSYGHPNEEFVRRATEAHCTVVLLSSSIRPGTQEELEAVLSTKTTQLAVIRMPRPGGRFRDRNLRTFLESHQSDFIYEVTGEPESIEVALTMVKVITRTIADLTNPDRREELFYEER